MSGAGKPMSAASGNEAKPGSLTAIDSRQLFQGGRQVQILHAGQVYVLRQTKDNKLILTK